MNNLKLCLFGICIFPLQGCSDEPASMAIDQGHSAAVSAASAVPAAQGAQGPQLKYFYASKDPSNGLSSGRMPLPATWSQLTNNKEFAYEGPNNIRVSNSQGGSFIFTNNPGFAQMMQEQGTANQPPMSIEQITQNFFMPVAGETNRQLIRTYELPELASKSLQDNSKIYSSMPQQLDAKSYALEWRDDKGMSFVSIVNVNIAYSQPSSYWILMNQYLEAPHEYFPAARDALINGLINSQTNPQWLAALNQRSQQNIQASNQGHQARMGALRAAGDAATQIGKTYSEISDINHQGYMNRDRANSAGHQNTINALGDRTVIANPDNGQRYNVESGSNQYWVNPNDGYFGSDNPNYDPRQDPNLNQQEWIEYQEVR